MVGDIDAIDNAIAALKENGLVLNMVEGLQDYLSCDVKFSTDKKRAWLGEPHLIENLVKEFCDHVKEIQSHKTPGMPTFLKVRPMVDSEKSP